MHASRQTRPPTTDTPPSSTGATLCTFLAAVVLSVLRACFLTRPSVVGSFDSSVRGQSDQHPIPRPVSIIAVYPWFQNLQRDANQFTPNNIESCSYLIAFGHCHHQHPRIKGRFFMTAFQNSIYGKAPESIEGFFNSRLIPLVGRTVVLKPMQGPPGLVRRELTVSVGQTSPSAELAELGMD